MTKTSVSYIDAHIGNMLKLRRVQMGVSLQSIGELLNVSFQQVQKYERGENKIASSNLFLLSKFLKTDITYFFEGVDSTNHRGVLMLDEDEEEWDFRLPPVADKELLSLVKAYYRISNSSIRQKIMDLMSVL